MHARERACNVAVVVVAGAQVGATNDASGEQRVRAWTSRVLGAPCRIVQQRAGARRVRRPAAAGGGGGGAAMTAAEGGGEAAVAAEVPSVGFANDGQYLLVSEVRMRAS
jgi:hypothetical protein